MSTPELIQFHIGHGKTGSSYLQAALAAGRSVLDAHGIAYPMEPKVEARALAGQITSGNLRSAESMTETMARYPGYDCKPRLFFSNETLHLLLTSRARGYGPELRKLFPTARMEFICYIRDPLDHAVSAYQQAVKRGGYVEDCAHFLASYDRPRRLFQLNAAIKQLDGVLTFVNYSRHRDNLVNTLENWLGLPAGSLPKPPRAQINRSMTRAELALQRALNAHMGQQASRLIADPLCEGLPDLKSETPYVPRADLEAFIARMTEMLSERRLRKMIPESEWLQIGTIDDYAERFTQVGDADVHQLTTAQLSVLAEAITKAVPKKENAQGRKRRRQMGRPVG
ncbi:MAG: hypothetical protein AAGF79_11870 [Pseudomonadota bacterium]